MCFSILCQPGDVAGAEQETLVVAPAKKKNWEEVYAERKQWWSLQPLKVVAPPLVEDATWAGRPVDRFLRHRMTVEGVTPAPTADQETLLRRATLVLTGLLPKSADLDSFLELSKQSPAAAYAVVVERLLASPQYGEHFARHWMDVVRFTETHGNEWNYDVAYAWRYRDYLIRAFNDDTSFDQLVREHVAGDLLPDPRWNAAGNFNESAIGTAFYRFGEVNHDSCVQFGIIGYDIVDNQLDTLTKAFQATTVACARCHDHKMDAVSTSDYHALLGVLRSSRSVQRTLDGPDVNREAMLNLQGLKQSLRDELAAIWKKEAGELKSEAFQKLADAAGDKTPPIGSPLHAWYAACKPDAANVAETWARLAADHAKESLDRSEFNRTQFESLADFREGIPQDWKSDGMGLRVPIATGGDFTVSTEGDAAVKSFLSRGVFTHGLSDKLNGALRSPTLKRGRKKVSFEIVGGRFSLARLVFNNCQLNYNHQHSLHHDDWTWVTVDFPENTDAMQPYAELLTYWDNPKFPDPLGTLGKDTENQRGPFSEHSQNPRTWWGIRRIVVHDCAETPREELTHLQRLYIPPPPTTREEAVSRYSGIAAAALQAFAAGRATDDDVLWLNWLLKNGMLSNRLDATPRLAQLTAQYREVENKQISLPTMMPGLADESEAISQPVLLRGDYTKPGDSVPPGYVRAITPEDTFLNLKGSGRRELSGIISSPRNPLTARVMVNRIWQWIFGAGLVGTPDDFGHLGAQPSHPELLDHLAAQFMADGWSVKKLVRSLVLSRAFQSASAPNAEARLRDPNNTLLSHFTARRMEAESIRDAMLQVSGRMDARMFGPSVQPYREKADPEKRLFTGPLDGEGRRSIYIKFQLMESTRFLNAFNLPGGKVTQGRREDSNVPAQSLAMLNDPLVQAMADHWAGEIVKDDCVSLHERITGMFRRALGRTPLDSERERFVAAVRSLAVNREVADASLMTERTVWKDAAHAMFNLSEFIFIP